MPIVGSEGHRNLRAVPDGLTRGSIDSGRCDRVVASPADAGEGEVTAGVLGRGRRAPAGRDCPRVRSTEDLREELVVALVVLARAAQCGTDCRAAALVAVDLTTSGVIHCGCGRKPRLANAGSVDLLDRLRKRSRFVTGDVERPVVAVPTATRGERHSGTVAGPDERPVLRHVGRSQRDTGRRRRSSRTQDDVRDVLVATRAAWVVRAVTVGVGPDGLPRCGRCREDGIGVLAATSLHDHLRVRAGRQYVAVATRCDLGAAAAPVAGVIGCRRGLLVARHRGVRRRRVRLYRYRVRPSSEVATEVIEFPADRRIGVWRPGVDRAVDIATRIGLAAHVTRPVYTRQVSQP